MAESGSKWRVLSSVSVIVVIFALAFAFVSAERSLKGEAPGLHLGGQESYFSFFLRAVNVPRKSDETGYQHDWPEMEFNWRIFVGTFIGFFGAAFGSVGGVGGGGIFVPMLSLIIGFDAKSATAMSKCMITGAAISTVYYNLKLRHPTLDMPIIDYDLALMVQPMLMLGISIGVTFNVIFADWMVTVLLILVFLATSTKAFLKGVKTWKKETIEKKEAAKRLESNASGGTDVEFGAIPAGPGGDPVKEGKQEVAILENVYWKELGLIVLVWAAFLSLQIAKQKTPTCSVAYWVTNLLQIPVSASVSIYVAIGLYRGTRFISSKGQQGSGFKVHQLVIYHTVGMLAGILGGLLGLGGGFIMSPMFLELGVPPQVSSATATFVMAFSSSMAVVEYFLLKRFPVPYALYFAAVATVAAIVGQHAVRKVIAALGRASLIIFILASMIFISAISLGGVGISNMVGRIVRHEYMGFQNLCKYNA